MKKLRIIIPILIALIAVTTISFSVVLAQEPEKGSSIVGKLSYRVAEILGLDASVVDDAIKQAHKDLRNEAIKLKLDALVSKGDLTQEQADKYFDWIQSKPNGIPTKDKQIFSSKGHQLHGKGYRHPFKSKAHFNRKDSWNNIRSELSDLVSEGELTQEQYEDKIKALETEKHGRDKRYSWDDIDRKLRTAVDAGEITQEEADKKLESLKVKKDFSW